MAVLCAAVLYLLLERGALLGCWDWCRVKAAEGRVSSWVLWVSCWHAGTVVSGYAAAADRLPLRRPQTKMRYIARQVLVIKSSCSTKFRLDISSNVILLKGVLRNDTRLPCSPCSYA